MTERPFQTWTFDKACDTMEWNPDSNVKLIVGDESDADLVLVGVFAPAKNDDADDDEEEEEVGPLVLEGAALELDERLGGMLKELAGENGKEFKNGGDVGGVTPAARVVDGGKVSVLVVLVAEDLVARLAIEFLLRVFDPYSFIVFNSCDM